MFLPDTEGEGGSTNASPLGAGIRHHMARSPSVKNLAGSVPTLSAVVSLKQRWRKAPGCHENEFTVGGTYKTGKRNIVRH